MRWLCVYFPQLPLEVFAGEVNSAEINSRVGANSVQAFAVARGQAKGGRDTVLAANAGAQAAGIHSDMRVSAAQALLPGLRIGIRDPKREHAALARLAAIALQFTSQVGLAPQALLLEIEGSLGLFGGLENLCARLKAALAETGYSHCLASAATPQAALWCARAERERHLSTHGEFLSACADLPLGCLTLETKTLLALKRLGLRHIAALLRLPRDGLARRFGAALLLDLDRAVGRAADVRPGFSLPDSFVGALAFPAPVQAAPAIVFAARRLFIDLQAYLRVRDLGVRAFDLKLKHERGALSLRFRLSDNRRAPEDLLLLLRERLERVMLEQAVMEISLHTHTLEAWCEPSGDLLTARSGRGETPGQLQDRLRARLGDTALSGLCLEPSHVPEQASRACELPVDGRSAVAAVEGPRPFWLLPAPLPLEAGADTPRWQGALQLMQGPERIETGWWQQDVARDYFVAQTEAGARVWIFRERRAPTPQWYLHGFFA